MHIRLIKTTKNNRIKTEKHQSHSCVSVCESVLWSGQPEPQMARNTGMEMTAHWHSRDTSAMEMTPHICVWTKFEAFAVRAGNCHFWPHRLKCLPAVNSLIAGPLSHCWLHATPTASPSYHTSCSDALMVNLFGFQCRLVSCELDSKVCLCLEIIKYVAQIIWMILMNFFFCQAVLIGSPVLLPHWLIPVVWTLKARKPMFKFNHPLEQLPCSLVIYLSCLANQPTNQPDWQFLVSSS